MTSEDRDTQGDREALAELLIREGAAPGDSVHSWRCEYPDVYSPCDCVEQMADEILASDWLAAHVARARAEAWGEGYLAGCQDLVRAARDGEEYGRDTVNPYRIDRGADQ